MARNGSGVYSPPGTDFPAVSGTTISSSKFNNVINDIATALTGSLAANGETTVTANLSLSGYKLTSIGAATARTDAASLANTQDGTGTYVATVGGTADAITLTPSPAVAAYVAGQRFVFIAGGTNTGATTVAVSGLAAKSITKFGTTALAAGDIASGALVTIQYDGTRFQAVSVTPASSLTAAQVLALLVTVDGAGSGLDADTLDGTSSAGFAAASHTHIPSIRNVSGTTDSPSSSDADNIVTLSSASSTTITLNSGVCSVGQSIAFMRLGAGSNTFAAGASQTINSPGSRLTIPEQYGTVVATYRATNTWILSGV